MVRRHFEAMNDALKLQWEIIAWQQKGLSFLDSYWRFSDPEGNQTKAYNEQILEQLKLAPEENVAAKIVQGLLELRLGQNKEALGTLSTAIREETIFSAVALAARSIVYSCRNEKQRAKQDLIAAYKLQMAIRSLLRKRSTITPSRKRLTSCGEENLLVFQGDPYSSENSLIHEFAHNMHLRGLIRVDSIG